MKSIRLALAMLALVGPLAAAPWTLDLAHTEVGFEVTHLMLAKVRGRFADYQGKVDLNDKDLTKSRIEIKIKAASVQTGQAKRDMHLQTPDFFDAGKNPELIFKSKKISRTADGFEVSGDFTMRGVTKPLTLTATLTEPQAQPKGGSKRGFSLRGALNRFDYGVAWDRKNELGKLMVAEEVALVIDGELNKK